MFSFHHGTYCGSFSVQCQTFATAKRLGLRRDLLFLANEAFAGSPPELRADWRAGRNGYTHDLVGHYHVELCPSKPGAMELLLSWRRQVFDAFAEEPPTDITIFPYDQGAAPATTVRRGAPMVFSGWPVRSPTWRASRSPASS